MHILQTQINGERINSKKLHESLILHISYKRPHVRHFFYFIRYIVKTICVIYVIQCQHTPNLASSINLIIDENEFKRKYAKLI